MIAANIEKRMPQSDSCRSGQEGINGRQQREITYSGQRKSEGTCADQTLRLIVDFAVGAFSLWVSLIIVGVIGLNNIGQQVILPLSLRIVVASALALTVCIISAPLLVPWFVVFVPAYLLIPRNSILWKWWLCTVLGSLVGVTVLWIDALVCFLLTPGPSISLNVPLLTVASIPAAVFGGTICFAAAMTENAASRKKERAVP